MIREEKRIPSDALKQIPSVIQAVSMDRDISAFYAFGSAAHDELLPLSDLDFAVLLSNNYDKSAYLDKQLEVIDLLNDVFRTDEIDLVIMNNAPLTFCYNIIKTGKMLYCRERTELVDFQERLTKLYLDFKYFRDGFDERFLKGVGYHG